MKHQLIRIIGLLLFAVGATPCQGDSPKSLIIGVQEFSYYPHYDIKGEEFVGYSRDLLDAFAATQHYLITYKTMPYRRLVQQFLAGKVDLQYPDNSYWLSNLKSDYVIIYSQPAVSYIDGAHVLAENYGKGIDAIQSLGTLIGFSPIQYFPLEQEGKLSISYAATVPGLVKQVHRKRLDAVYLNVDVVKHQERDTAKALVFDESLPFIKSGYTMSTIQHPEVIEDFNQFLVTHKKTVDAIKRKYGLSLD